VSYFAILNQYLKLDRGTDCFLKLRNMRVESLVIVDEDATVNTNPIFVHTARHVTEIGGIRREQVS
jgi:hypothetical protein